MENHYIDFIVSLCNERNIKKYKLTNIENSFDKTYIIKLLGEYGLRLTNKEEILFDLLEEQLLIECTDLKSIIILLIRDCFWCEVVDIDNNIKFNMGYDLYMNVESTSDLESILDIANKNKLFVEER